MSKKVILVLLICKIVFLFIVSYFTHLIIFYNPQFPNSDGLITLPIPRLLYAFAHFDGLHYTSIAQMGYETYEQAFFPLYPLLIRLVSYILPIHELISGIILSNLLFIIGMISLYLTVRKLYTESIALWTFIFLLVFPTSFFFNTLYTESLFLAISMTGVLFFINNKKLHGAFCFAASTLTRLVGIFNPILLFLKVKGVKRISKKEIILITTFSFLGLFAYMLYLYISTGDPLFFLTSQPKFGANRTTSFVILPQVIWRYIKIFLTLKFDRSYFIAIFEFLSFSFFALTISLFAYQGFIKRKFNDLVISFYSACHLLLPTLTGTLLSIPRFGLFCLASFLYIAQIKNMKVKLLIVFIFAIIQIIAFMYFVSGYFIS